jgi:acyl dehydratase
VAYDVAAVKARWEGHETPLAWGRYPVERDPIRRHCHMVDDLNPRFLEHGECPPVMLDYFAGAGAWPAGSEDILALVREIPTPGDRLVNLGHEFEWCHVVRVGERLGMRHKVLALDVRATRLDPLSVWIRTETTIVREDGDVVARRRNQLMIHRPAGVGAVGGERAEPRARAIAADDGERERLPGFSMPLTPTRMVLQVSGSQDLYPVHHDREFARAGGHADTFVNTGFLRALLCRLVTGWMAETDVLKRLAFTMRRPHVAGDTITVGGRVTGRRAEAGHDAFDLEVWVENPRDGIATPGTATVHRPR